MLNSQSGFFYKSYLLQNVPRSTLRCNVLPAIALTALQQKTQALTLCLCFINPVEIRHSLSASTAYSED